MDKTGIRGSINRFGEQVSNTLKNTTEKLNRELYSEQKLLLEPTCDTIKLLLVYSNWIMLATIALLFIGILLAWPHGCLVFLSLLGTVVALYVVYVNTKWPDMGECARARNILI